MRAVRLLVIFLLWWPVAGQGAEILFFEVTQEGSDYRVTLDARLAAPVALVWRRLIDYDRFEELSPSINMSEVLAAPGPNRHRVRTQAYLCVFVFCKDVAQLYLFQEQGFGILEAKIEPEGSDFQRGLLRWRLWAQGGATRLEFSAELCPDFFVPPLIGSWAIKRVLHRETLAIVNNLERLALEGE